MVVPKEPIQWKAILMIVKTQIAGIANQWEKANPKLVRYAKGRAASIGWGEVEGSNPPRTITSSK